MNNLPVELDSIEAIPQIENLRNIWETLLQKSDCDRAFSSIDWYLGCCREMSLKPLVITITHRRDIVAILPLTKCFEKKTISFASHLSDYNDLILDNYYKLKSSFCFSNELREYITERHPSYRMILQDIRIDSSLAAQLKVNGGENYLDIEVKSSEVCSYANISKGLNHYLATRSTNFNRDIRRKLKMAANNNISFQVETPNKNQAKRLTRIFLKLHLDRVEDSIFQIKENVNVINAVLPSMLSNNKMKAFTLNQDGEIIAIQLATIGAKSLCYWNGGFKTTVSKYSPGKLLFLTQIEYCVANGIEEFDMLRGFEQYKSDWSNGCRKLVSISF